MKLRFSDGLAFVLAAGAAMFASNAALAADLPGAAPSGDVVDAARMAGLVELYGGAVGHHGEISSNEDSFFGLVGGAAKFGSGLGGPGGRFGGQFDLFADWAPEERGGGGSSNAGHAYQFGVGGHLGWRTGDVWAGAFGSAARINNEPFDENMNGVVLGLEVLYGAGRHTLYGQAGYLSSGGDADGVRDAAFGRLVGRLFPHDNLKLQGEISGGFGEMDSDNDDMFWLAGGLEAEYLTAMQPLGRPLSLFAAYDATYFHQDESNTDVIASHVVRLGGRMYFGSASLIDNEHNGVPLDLPDYGHVISFAADPLE